MRPVILFFLCLLSTTVSAHLNMRKCLLLPILHQGNNEWAYDIFKSVENYLKKSDWCFYQSNSEILNIINDFKNTLNSDLKKKEVLELVAQKTGSGSLIRIDIENLVSGINLNLDIIGSSGDDIYFRNQKEISNKNIADIVQPIQQWLSIYAKRIPYDAHVTGILEEQLTIDIGSNNGLRSGHKFTINRLIDKKKHPLLNEIVDWDTRQVAEGKILYTTEMLSHGRATHYKGDSNIQVGDWVSMVRKKQDHQSFEQTDDEWGTLGYFQVSFTTGPGFVTINPTGWEANQIAGTQMGGKLKLELWATRHIFSSLTFQKNLGNYQNKSGDIHDSSLEDSHMAWILGYKHLPLGIFYGPQVNAYLGYEINSYHFNASDRNGPGDGRFSGFLFGIQGNTPLTQNIRMAVDFGLIYRPSFEEEIPNYGKYDSTSHNFISFEISYTFAHNLTLHTAVGTTTSEASFISPPRKLNIQKTFFQLGTSYQF